MVQNTLKEFLVFTTRWIYWLVYQPKLHLNVTQRYISKTYPKPIVMSVIRAIHVIPSGGFLKKGYLSHPFLDGIFHEINHPAI